MKCSVTRSRGRSQQPVGFSCQKSSMTIVCLSQPEAKADRQQIFPSGACMTGECRKSARVDSSREFIAFRIRPVPKHEPRTPVTEGGGGQVVGGRWVLGVISSSHRTQRPGRGGREHWTMVEMRDCRERAENFRPDRWRVFGDEIRFEMKKQSLALLIGSRKAHNETHCTLTTEVMLQRKDEDDTGTKKDITE